MVFTGGMLWAVLHENLNMARMLVNVFLYDFESTLFVKINTLWILFIYREFQTVSQGFCLIH